MKYYVLLDSDSSIVFCSQTLTQEFDLKGQWVAYDLSTLNKAAVIESRLVNLSFLSDTEGRLDMSGAYTMDTIPEETSKLNVSLYPHLADSDLVSVDRVTDVDVLKRGENDAAFISSENRRGSRGHPFTIQISWIGQ